MNFGEVLQTKRKSMGLTQEDLADKLFVSSKTVLLQSFPKNLF